jgi:hypothetical protein
MGKTLFGCGFFILSLAAGCGDSKEEEEEDTGGAIPLESMPSRFAGTVCKITYQCCTTAQRGDNPFLGDTEAECKSNYTTLFTLAVPEWNQSIAKKRLRYDGAAFASCLSQVEAAGCTGLPEDTSACEAFLVPLVMTGGACTQQGECIDSACFGGDSTNDVDGTCGPPVANGAECEDDVQCASGYCSGLACAPKMVNGATCDVDAACESNHCSATTFVCAAPTTNVCE